MKALPFLLGLALAGGCVAHSSLRKDLYPAAPPAAKGAARVVLVRRPGPPESVRRRELPWASAEIELKGYPEAAAAMLGSLYEQVSMAPSAEEARGADFIVTMSTDYPRTVGLGFADGSGKPLAAFSRPGVEVRDNPDADSRLIKIMTPPAMVVSFGTIGLAFAYQAREAGLRVADEISDATAKALAEIRRQIAATPALARHMLEPMVQEHRGAPEPDLRKFAAQAEELEREAARLRAKISELEKQARTAHGPK